MPRKRKAQPGSGGAYANRTDLTAGTQAISVPTGLPYGERQELVQAQQQAPLPQQAPDQALAQAQAHPFQPVGLGDPTQRPNEPIQHGLPSGPGAGPEVLQPQPGTSATLQQLAQQTGNPAIAAMAERARRYGI